MKVLLGNKTAVECYRDPASDDPDKVRMRPIEGQRVTEFVFPEGVGLQEALSTIQASMPFHFAEGSKPVWVESDSAGLEAVLKEQFGISSKLNRPASWGQDTGGAQVTLDKPKDDE